MLLHVAREQDATEVDLCRFEDDFSGLKRFGELPDFACCVEPMNLDLCWFESDHLGFGAS